MASTPALNEEQLANLLIYRDQRILEGTSLWRIAADAGTALGLKQSQATLYRYMVPSAREQSRRAARKRRRRQNPEARVRRQQRRWRRDHRAHVRAYERAYRILRHHTLDYVAPAFEDSPALSLTALVTYVHRRPMGSSFRPTTIERALRRTEAAQRAGQIPGPPFLYEAPPGTWHYSEAPPREWLLRE